MNDNKMKINNKKGVLIAFEGISGSGKSESIKKLSDHLNKEGFKVVIAEWNSNNTARKIADWLHRRGMLTSVLYSMLQWISFLTDYFLKIKPALKNNSIVIADRYIYTGLVRDKTNGAPTLPGQVLYPAVRKPDILFFNDVKPEICYERIIGRGKALFHTNKRILYSRSLKNKDLYYIKKMRNEYLRLFRNLKERKGFNMIPLNEKNIDMLITVQEYLIRKFDKNPTLRIQSSFYITDREIQ